MFAAKNELFTTPSGYQIQRSLRFRSSASAYLNRTNVSSPTDAKKWTASFWFKRGAFAYQYLFSATNSGSDDSYIQLYLDQLSIGSYTGVSTNYGVNTIAVLRDPAAWYHAVCVYDSANATAANRAIIYINGIQQAVTNQADGTFPLNHAGMKLNNGSQTTKIGGSTYFDGYLTEVNFIDGQALTPSSFGAINPVTGVWSATKYAGTYGTNGFYLNFTDNSAATATTIGKDYSGNGNNWTPNNISVTAGVTYDSMLDAPLGAGGGERGNYAVLNPLLSSGGTTANANLQVTTTVGVGHSRPTMAIPANGKWYCEFTAVSAATSSDYIFGIVGIDTPEASYGYNQTPSYSYSAFGEKIVNGSFTASFYSTFTNGDIIGCAVNLDGNEINWYKNGTLAGSATSIANGSYFWMISDASGSRQTTTAFNAGQRPFSYTPPTGFKALHTGNLAAPVIALPAQNMAATTYTGTGASLTVANTVNSTSFQPDWVWVKGRSGATDHALYDSVRGVQKQIESNSTGAETTETTGLTAFGSTGFTVGALAQMNTSAATYVAWQWKAGGTAVSNTAGSITSSVSANTTAGFSVVTWAGIAGGQQTVGHGLGVAPVFIISKNRTDSATAWYTATGFLSGWNWSTDYFTLNTTNAKATDGGGTVFPVAPTSTRFTVGDAATNGSGKNYVAYCFTPVAGYSAFGSYTGNGSTDGPFVYTGFRPKWVMIKRTSGAGEGWFMYDTSRSTFNYAENYLVANGSDAEIVYFDDAIDIVSNGIKVRAGGTRTAVNDSGSTYIYMAFAESPFKNSLAR